MVGAATARSTLFLYLAEGLGPIVPFTNHILTRSPSCRPLGTGAHFLKGGGQALSQILPAAIVFNILLKLTAFVNYLKAAIDHFNLNHRLPFFTGAAPAMLTSGSILSRSIASFCLP